MVYINCVNVKFLWQFFNSADIKLLMQIRVPSRGCRTMPNRITFPTLQYSNLESEQRLKRNFGSTVDRLRQTGVGKPPTGKNGARTKSNRDDYRHTVSRKNWIIYENIQLFWDKNPHFFLIFCLWKELKCYQGMGLGFYFDSKLLLSDLTREIDKKAQEPLAGNQKITFLKCNDEVTRLPYG